MSLARVVEAGRELLHLVRHKQQTPSIRICACARKDYVAEDVLEDVLLGGPKDTTISPWQEAPETDTQISITSDPDSDASTAQLTSDVDQGASQVNPHCRLRRNLVPRYPCGTCWFRDCTCVMAP